MTPQCQTILNHLQSRGSISNCEAQMVHKIRALPRRISDLEDLGHDFIRVPSTDETGQRYTRYHLMQEDRT